ncbi:unnamed protein product, partial [Allacma fusca]
KGLELLAHQHGPL